MVFSVSQWPFRCDRDLFGNVRVGRVYVRVSRDRFEAVEFSPTGIRVHLTGSEGETVEVTALRPLSTASDEWIVMVERVTFEGDRAVVVFGCA